MTCRTHRRASRAAPAQREAPALPGHLAERARREAAEMVGERKQVTILFCDLESSMERSGRLDPDAWRELMDRFFRLIAKCVHRYEGTVDKFTGDGGMAIFGAPLATTPGRLSAFAGASASWAGCWRR